MKVPKKTLLEFLDVVPPCVVRIMAVEPASGRRKPRLKTLNELVDAGKLSRRMVQRLAYLKTWEGVRLSVASAFIAACGVDILHRKDIRRFTYQYADKNFSHLDEQQRQRFYNLMGWVK